jgi:hypothetical protein
MDRIDWVQAVRGASTGFTVLVISGLINNPIRQASWWAGLVEIVLGLLIAGVVAGWRTRTADAPMLSGGVAALLSFTLTIPLMYLSSAPIDYKVAVLAGAGLTAVGAVSGLVLSRREQ